MEEIAEDELCADEDDAEFEPELIRREAGAEECGEADGVADGEAEEDGPEDVLDLRKGDVVSGAEVVAEGLDSLPSEANAEQQRSAWDEREELPPERASSRGVQRQRDGAGGQGCGLPADVRDEVEADERTQCECDEDGNSVGVEDEFFGLGGNGIHVVLLRVDVWGGARALRLQMTTSAKESPRPEGCVGALGSGARYGASRSGQTDTGATEHATRHATERDGVNEPHGYEAMGV
jgi:hypothetical protein